MRNWMLNIGLKMLWTAAGGLGKDLMAWVEEAGGHGLNGRNAFDYVWRKAKTRFPEVGGWLLNLLIETAVGRRHSLERKLRKKLRWPKKLTPQF